MSKGTFAAGIGWTIGAGGSLFYYGGNPFWMIGLGIVGAVVVNWIVTKGIVGAGERS